MVVGCCVFGCSLCGMRCVWFVVCWLFFLIVRCCLLVVDCRVVFGLRWLSSLCVMRCRCLLFVVVCSLLVVCWLVFVVCCVLCVVCRLLRVVCRCLCVVCCALVVIGCVLDDVCCVLFVICCLSLLCLIMPFVVYGVLVDVRVCVSLVFVMC